MDSSEEPCCDICGDEMREKAVHKLLCGHSYHYECLMKSFQTERKASNQCPLCRRTVGLLPVVNALPRLIRGVHVPLYPTDQYLLPSLQCEPCSVTLKTGKRKGDCCGSKCMLGMSTCKRHHQSYLKSQDKLKALNTA